MKNDTDEDEPVPEQFNNSNLKEDPTIYQDNDELEEFEDEKDKITPEIHNYIHNNMTNKSNTQNSNKKNTNNSSSTNNKLVFSNKIVSQNLAGNELLSSQANNNMPMSNIFNYTAGLNNNANIKSKEYSTTGKFNSLEPNEEKKEDISHNINTNLINMNNNLISSEQDSNKQLSIPNINELIKSNAAAHKQQGAEPEDPEKFGEKPEIIDINYDEEPMPNYSNPSMNRRYKRNNENFSPGSVTGGYAKKSTHSTAGSRGGKSLYTCDPKFESYNLEQMRYDFIKDYANVRIDKDRDFLQRMQFDVYKRQFMEERLNKLIEQNKAKLDEEERIKAFNRLIQDANRRIEAQENMENLKNKLEEDLTSTPSKKYNDEEWNEIYEKRFKSFEENVNKKLEKERQKELENKLKREQEEIDLVKNKKKATKKQIEESGQRMYDEAKKRKLKMEEKMSRLNNLPIYDDDPTKYMKKIKGDVYSFLEDEIDEGSNNNNSKHANTLNYNNKPLKKTKNMAVSEFNNRRFDVHKSSKSNKNFSPIYNNNRNMPSNLMDLNNKSIPLTNAADDFFDGDITEDRNMNSNLNAMAYPYNYDGYNIDEERNKLIEMAAARRIKSNTSNETFYNTGEKHKEITEKNTAKFNAASNHKDNEEEEEEISKDIPEPCTKPAIAKGSKKVDSTKKKKAKKDDIEPNKEVRKIVDQFFVRQLKHNSNI